MIREKSSRDLLLLISYIIFICLEKDFKTVPLEFSFLGKQFQDTISHPSSAFSRPDTSTLVAISVFVVVTSKALKEAGYEMYRTTKAACQHRTRESSAWKARVAVAACGKTTGERARSNIERIEVTKRRSRIIAKWSERDSGVHFMISRITLCNYANRCVSSRYRLFRIREKLVLLMMMMMCVILQ